MSENILKPEKNQNDGFVIGFEGVYYYCTGENSVRDVRAER